MQWESRKVSDGHRIHDGIFWNSPAHLWQWMDKSSSHIPGKAWWLAKCLHFPGLGENLHNDGRALEWIKEDKGFLCKPQKHLTLSEIFLQPIDVLLASLNRTKEHPEAQKRAAQNFPLKECIWAGHSWVVRLQLHIGLRYSFSMHQHLIADNPASPCPRKEGLEQGNHYHSKIYLPASWDCSHWMTPCDCKGPVLSPEDGTELKAHTDAKTPLKSKPLLWNQHLPLPSWFCHPHSLQDVMPKGTFHKYLHTDLYLRGCLLKNVVQGTRVQCCVTFDIRSVLRKGNCIYNMNLLKAYPSKWVKYIHVTFNREQLHFPDINNIYLEKANIKANKKIIEDHLC